MKAIILAAGSGTRLLPLTLETPKCLIRIKNVTLLEHVLLSLSKCGVKNAAIVVGHFADKVVAEIGTKKFGVNIRFIINTHYDFHASEYSLSLADEELEDTKALIMEGDILLNTKLLQLIANDRNENSALVDTRKVIEPTRAVITLGRNGIVDEFVFDPSHQDVLRLVDDRSRIVGESMQVWKLSVAASNALADDLRHYKRTLGTRRDSRTNLYSINRVISTHRMHYIKSQGLDWRNINTIHDIETAESMDLEE